MVIPQKVQVVILAREPIFGVLLMVLGLWLEISENEDRGSAQNFDTDLVSIVVWPGEPFSEKCLF